MYATTICLHGPTPNTILYKCQEKGAWLAGGKTGFGKLPLKPWLVYEVVTRNSMRTCEYSRLKNGRFLSVVQCVKFKQMHSRDQIICFT